MSVVEALYIFDEHNIPLLEHTYTGRPPPGSTILPLYLQHPSPQPSLIYLPNTTPPTLLYSIIQDRLLYLSPCSTDTEPLQVLEFLHRVADALEDFLGSPLLASKIEGNYDVVAQLLSEMVDGGVINCTEPNALRDVVEAPSFMKSILGGVGLPSTTPSPLNPSNTTFSLSSRPSLPRPIANLNNASPVPWRRANVRHTSNELYVDIVETLHITLSPSGRPLSALSHGTIAFTAKVSGVPDLLLHLSCPGGIANTVALPVFHPCVRLNRWKERPGELSFVPPDGRFVLAGYEVDLLGSSALDAFSTATKGAAGPRLNVPATATVIPSLGPTGADFEVRLTLNPRFMGKAKAPSPLPSATGSSFPRTGGLGRGIGGSAGFGSQGTTASPSIEELVVHVPLPVGVRNVAELRVTKGPGDAGYTAGDRCIEWRISAREVGMLMAGDRGTGLGAVASMRGTVVSAGVDEDGDGGGSGGAGELSNPYDYDDDTASSYQAPEVSPPKKEGPEADARRVRQNKVLMPSCATVSFSVKGWLASGIRVESLMVDQKKSKGLGAGVTPYKGVKYLCVSRKGVESRC
ncbi:clathrin adaptor, mu subunit [Lindgomyces ingoldianus]|uniref:Clathrin adaptor, mu subunit n=1 Tax=Lindgomyces ingoldianus TaxID=673940 RepID=A0ACB6RDQ0_9PLEO|nr:clathrin adaptor, mu subunit [Lindgomyces ingoldianus]KAF2477165.1 clathrin adaptor, mu subunit [Lindgomyces ingoldianus]